MQRVDGAYLYEFGTHMRALERLEEKDCERFDIYFELSNAHSALTGMMYQSVFSDGWKVVSRCASELIAEISEHLINFSDTSTFNAPVKSYQINFIKNKYREFDTVMKAELQNIDIYYVSQKGAFDSKRLTESGIQLFPKALPLKCPEATEDAQMGARCLAFELWTAMGFHFHRANEAVLRRYFESVIGAGKKPKVRTMGTMLKALEDANAGDADIRAALKNIVVFHRNPLAHPEHHIASADEALSLYAAIRACTGYMLDKLPEISTLEFGTDHSSDVSEKPFLLAQPSE